VFRADALMLQAMKGASQVGLYGVAYRFLDSFLFVSWGLGNVALPRIARAAPEERDRTFETTLALILTFYVPLAVGAYFVGDEVVEFVFGSRYRSAGSAVFWLMGAGVFYGAAYLGRMACIAVGRGRPIAYVAAAALVVNIAGNAFAIPRYGFEGASVMTFVSSIIEATLIVGFYARERDALSARGPWLVPLLAGAAMALAMAVVGDDALVQGITGSLTFAVTLVVLARSLAGRELEVALALVRRKKES
jgi:O-antigen/teichoic acid export membrane protein